MNRRQFLAAAGTGALSLAMLAACSTGDDQVVHGGSFTFVTPGGKTDFSYPPDERKAIGTLAGPDLMTNKTISVDDFAGTVVVLNFWGSWCPPCREEQDALSLLSTQLADSGVQFLGIDLREPSQTDGQDFHLSKKVPYPSIFDQTMRTILSIRGYPSAAIPSTIVLDRGHRVAQIWLDPTGVPIGAQKKRIAAIAAEDSAASGSTAEDSATEDPATAHSAAEDPKSGAK